jgi:hypothetical protein
MEFGMSEILARLTGGPLDAQVIPLEAETVETVDDELVLQWEQGQLIYRRAGEAENTGPNDGPTTVPYRFDSAI